MSFKMTGIPMNPKTTGIIIVVFLFLIVITFIAPKRPRSYEAQDSLLTKHELFFYRSLVPVVKELGYMICCKVRMADIIKPVYNTNWQTAFNKISSKHIDFVLCDKKTMKPLLAVELDDRSHERFDRIERDNFVNIAFKDAGIPILHVKNSDDLKQKITKILNNPKEKGQEKNS